MREAYFWICHNYENGDEGSQNFHSVFSLELELTLLLTFRRQIHLYGFSRGAYLVRLLSTLISLIGLLDPLSNLLPTVFSHLTSSRTSNTQRARREQDELDRLLDSDEIRLRKEEQVRARKGGFLVQVLGVFETVPLFHLHTLSPGHDLLPIHNPFSLSDSNLEPEIEKTFQALAMAEDRPSYVPVIYRHDSKIQGQELLQAWFPGFHSDVGGGGTDHELADLSLDWLIGHVESELSINLDFISSLSKRAIAPWGSHKPHA